MGIAEFAADAEVFDAEIAEFIDQAAFTVMLNADVPGQIHLVVNIRRQHIIDEYLNVRADADDAVFIPLSLLETFARTGTERGDGSIAFFGRGGVVAVGGDKPHPSIFVIKAAGPLAVGGIDFGLISPNAVSAHLAAEHKAGVALIDGRKDIRFKDEIGKRLLRSSGTTCFDWWSDDFVADDLYSPHV